MSCEDLASKLKLNPNHLRAVESGYRRPFSDTTTELLCDILGADVDELLALADARRDVFRLPVRGLSAAHSEAGVALRENWNDLTPAELDSIRKLVSCG
jgi:transcriptional regulator with XRE-family HTH domain